MFNIYEMGISEFKTKVAEDMIKKADRQLYKYLNSPFKYLHVKRIRRQTADPLASPFDETTYVTQYKPSNQRYQIGSMLTYDLDQARKKFKQMGIEYEYLSREECVKRLKEETEIKPNLWRLPEAQEFNKMYEEKKQLEKEKQFEKFVSDALGGKY